VGSLRSREKKPDQAYRSRKEAAKVPNTAGIVGSLFSKEYSDRDKKREPWKENKKEKTKKWIARYSTKREPPLFPFDEGSTIGLAGFAARSERRPLSSFSNKRANFHDARPIKEKWREVGNRLSRQPALWYSIS
jgi:hypothetical protein